MKPNIGLDEGKAKKISVILNKILADMFVIYVKAYNFHWNVTGPRFKNLHTFFEEIYDGIEENIDIVGERIRTIGFPVKAMIKDFSAMSSIKESEEEQSFDGDQMIGRILSDLQELIRFSREAEKFCAESGDIASSDVLIKMVSEMEKQAWFARSHIV